MQNKLILFPIEVIIIINSLMDFMNRKIIVFSTDF